MKTTTRNSDSLLLLIIAMALLLALWAVLPKPEVQPIDLNIPSKAEPLQFSPKKGEFNWTQTEGNLTITWEASGGFCKINGHTTIDGKRIELPGLEKQGDECIANYMAEFAQKATNFLSQKLDSNAIRKAYTLFDRLSEFITPYLR